MRPDHEQTVAIAKHAGDIVAGVVVLGTISKLLPPISALIAIIYTLIRIYETRTVQRLLGREP